MCNLRRHAVNSGQNMEKLYYCEPRRRHLIEVIYFYLEDKTLFCERKVSSSGSSLKIFLSQGWNMRTFPQALVART